MVSPLFTALAMIACGRVDVPPPPAQSLPVPRSAVMCVTRTPRLTGCAAGVRA